MIISTLLYVLALLVLGGGLIALIFATADTDTVTVSGDGYYDTSVTGTLTATSIVVMIIGYLVIFVASMFIQAAFLSGCLDIADGKPVSVGSFFKPRHFGAMILTALLVGALTAVGLALLVVPGIIVGFLAQFAIAFVVDRSLSPVSGLKASFGAAKNNVGGALLSWLVQYAVLLVGTVICAVGLLVAGPLATLIQTYTYRRLSGGQVVPIS
ncbi:hypothetical protein A5707_18530 [Mycobacterium kyorinense]|uniref:Uncharacterized protein n=1 Tax=Mycobacterium kyorinense TaxID=487514 RepID=A0A1A2ZF28_9MYCO|nr:hypothetical protein A5707_18530 [Mycobacterium kyorinense]